ncbi:MAG: isoleucyl-tRNA synthetase, partial [Hyphomicrobiales bacterium]|nr:isoleucyl-tRNA synthetase [Hyphomicrobiales bacterium]
LAAKWAKVRSLRRVVTGALEIERAQKRIGSSLEAEPHLWISAEQAQVLDGLDLPDLFITSAAVIENGAAPADGFTLPDVPGVTVKIDRAKGRKCARSWKISEEVGADAEYPDVTPRDAQALRELKSAGLL